MQGAIANYTPPPTTDTTNGTDKGADKTAAGDQPAPLLPVPAYGEPVFDQTSGKLVGSAQFDPNNGNPLKNPNGDPAAGSGNGEKDKATTGEIDPSLKTAFNDSIAGLDDGITQAKSNLASAAATLQNDPAATAAISSIIAKYDQQIKAMKEKNKILAGGYITNAARSGALQFANEMTSNFLSDEQGRAEQRVTDLVSLELSATLKAQQAYKDADLKAFSAATKDLQTAQKGKIDAINKLLTATDKAVRTNQAQVKIDAQKIKDKAATDTKTATALANTVAAGIKEHGLTGADEKTYISMMAEKSGISNPDLLSAAVIKAKQVQDKADLAKKNTENTIANRDARTNIAATKATKAGKAASTTFKISTAISKATPQFEKVKGADGYIAPEKWMAARTNWNSLGGTDASFNTTFKKYLNPASYEMAGFKKTGPKS